MTQQDELPVVEYTVTFRVPEGLVGRGVDEPLDAAIQRAAEGMLLRLMSRYGSDYRCDQDDPYLVTAVVEVEDDPIRPHAEERIAEILTVMVRMLVQRCLDPDDDEVLNIELHSDKEALEVLAAYDRVGASDREGQVRGYVYY